MCEGMLRDLKRPQQYKRKWTAHASRDDTGRFALAVVMLEWLGGSG